MKLVDSSCALTVNTTTSEDGKFRFMLEKQWDLKKPKALFILLNPSKGTLLKLDNTIANIANQSVKYDFGCFRLVNLFPLMATKTSELSGKLDLGKLENLDIIRNSIEWADSIYIAWGCQHKYVIRKREVENILVELAENKKVMSWKDSKGRYPRHLRTIEDHWHLEDYTYKFI